MKSEGAAPQSCRKKAGWRIPPQKATERGATASVAGPRACVHACVCVPASLSRADRWTEGSSWEASPPASRGGRRSNQKEKRRGALTRLNQHFRRRSGPRRSTRTHNGGMTRFCARLIILDTHTHTLSSTRAQAEDKHWCLRRSKHARAHTRIIIPHPSVSLHSLPPKSGFIHHLIVGHICCRRLFKPQIVFSPESVTHT